MKRNTTEHDEIRTRLQQQFRKTSSGRITGTYQGASRSTTDLANGRKLLRATVASNTPPFVSAAGCGWRCTHEQLLSSRTCFLFTCAHRPLFFSLSGCVQSNAAACAKLGSSSFQDHTSSSPTFLIVVDDGLNDYP